MRARNLKPAFFKNEYLAQISPYARLLFSGLWCLADREGRLEDRPMRIKAELFPFETVDVEVLLQELADNPGDFITRYVVDGCPYIEINNFAKHQKPHLREAESTIPPYSSEKAQPRQCLGTTKVVSSPAESLLLDPLSPTHEIDASASGGGGFEKFWKEYPKKVTKKETQDYWKAQKLDGKLPEILNGLNAWKMTDQWQKDSGKFIPDPIRFLKKEKWRDEVGLPEPQNDPLPGATRHHTRDDLLRFPYLRFVPTGEVFPVNQFQARPESPSMLFHGADSMPVSMLEGLEHGEEPA